MSICQQNQGVPWLFQSEGNLHAKKSKTFRIVRYALKYKQVENGKAKREFFIEFTQLFLGFWTLKVTQKWKPEK